MKKKIDKYTNYDVYIIVPKMAAHEVDKQRLEGVVDKLTEKYKNPYIRFMWVSNVDTAMYKTAGGFKWMREINYLKLKNNE